MSAPAATPAVPERSRWGLILLAVAAGIVCGTQVGKVPPALPMIRAELAIDLVTAGWVASLFTACGAVFGIAAGMLAQRLGPRRSLAAAAAFLCLGGLWGGFSTGAPSLLASRFVESMGFVGIIVTAPAIIARSTRPRDRGLALGIWSSYLPAGVGLGLLTAPLLLADFGWRALWIVNAVLPILVVGALIAQLSRTGTPPLEGPQRPPMRLALLRIGPWLLATSFLFYALNWYALMSWLPTYLIEVAGLELASAALFTAMVVIVNVIGNVGAGALLQRGQRRWRLMAVALIVMAASSIGLFGTDWPVAVKIALATAFSLVGGLLPGSAFAGAPVHAPSPAHISTVNGVIVQGANTGSLLGPPVMAAAVGLLGGWQGANLTILVGSALALALVLWLRQVERRLPAAPA